MSENKEVEFGNSCIEKQNQRGIYVKTTNKSRLILNRKVKLENGKMYLKVHVAY